MNCPRHSTFPTTKKKGDCLDHPQRDQCREALMQVALNESKTLSVSLAEIIAYLQRKEHLAALGTFQGLDQKFKFLGTVLEATARLP